MSKHIIIIGAGISGLTAGIYAKRSGFDVTIVEQHSIAGGMCTSWRRNGYLFEGAIHWLTGSSPKTKVYQIWEDTGALSKDVPVLLHDPFRSIEWEGQLIHLYRDIDKTVSRLIALSPGDAKLLRRLAKDVKAVTKMTMPVFDLRGVKMKNPKPLGFGYMFKMLPAMPAMIKYGKISCAQFVSAFKHPAVRRLFSMLPGDYAATAIVSTLATLHSGDGGYPENGSLSMVHRMAKTFTGLGGKLMFNTHVEKVTVKDGRATGISAQSGAIDADAVIVTQETIAALDKLFDEQPGDEWLKTLRENTTPAVCTFVSIGVRAELPDNMIPEWELETPITFAGQTLRELSFNSYRRYAPKGGTALTTAFMTDTYDFWKKAKDEGRYEAEKQALSEQIVSALCRKYPQCGGKIEVVDIATPLTYERYTGAYRGSWMGVMKPGARAGLMYPGYCENISGLYFAGHRMMPPGGLPVALTSGRAAAQLVCRQFDTEFK
ncbi:MAG TPA: NAD(P)/FAD-dependent oxidoreductase [Treponema sp.]|nr:NAD(P)/FAD-dependent oxidoreductase [Treponema sp.]